MSEIPKTFHVALDRLRTILDEHDGEHADDPSTIQAMPLVLNIPKNPVPDRMDLVAAAAQASVECCLDPRAGQDGDYSAHLQKWYGARIRKIARRARASKWEGVQTFPGVTSEHNSGLARAFVPCAVQDTPEAINKLQIEGTDLDASEESEIANGVVVYLDAGLGMTVGKSAAQAGHATMLLAAAMSEQQAWDWAQAGFWVNAREVPSEQFRALCATAQEQGHTLGLVQDAGYTEVAPGSFTACAVDLGLPGEAS